jgi:membrane-associated protease RseP (regulator of RpoE activity)
MDDLTAQKDVSPVLTEIPRYVAPPPTPVGEPQPMRGIPPLNVALFLLTLLTTTMAGAYQAGASLSLAEPIQSLINLGAGLSFSLPLMGILGAHELGHYILSRRNRVDATLPYFIPAPFPSVFIIGTFGAFIRMKSPPRSRRVMFDIGAAGPWAGMLLALPAVWIGLKLSTVEPLSTAVGGLQLGNSMLFWVLSRLALGVNPDTVNITLHPLAFAGWLGFFVTTLNLLPVGQLDGGHVIYSLFGGRWHRVISRTFVLGCILMVIVPLALGYNFWAGWLFWVVLLLFLGLGHPSTVDAGTPLSGGRRLAAWLTVVLFILTFSPVPISLAPGGQPPAPQEKVYSVMMHQTPAHGSAPLHRLPIGI